MHACTCSKHSLWVGEDHTESNRNNFNCDGSQSSLQTCKTSTGCVPKKASESISTLQFPNLVLSVHVTSLHIQLHKRSQTQSSYTWEQDIAVGNHVAPLSISKISKEITKCIIFGCTKRAGAKHYHPREAYVSTYRISSNKRPGHLFQIWVLRGARNKKLLGLTVCTCKL